MGTSKSDFFTQTDNRIAGYAKALSHPARVAILRMLLKRRSCVCGDIVNELPLSQSTVSQHLKELKSSGLIKGTVEGASVCYCIDERAWNDAGKVLGGFLSFEPKLGAVCC